MTDSLVVLEKKTCQVEREIAGLRHLIQRLRRRRVPLTQLVNSISKHLETDEDTTEIIRKMRERKLPW